MRAIPVVVGWTLIHGSMYQTIKKQIRPSLEVEFFKPRSENSPLSQECRDYVDLNYLSTGKQLFSEQTVSDNGLELTIILIWDSSESEQEFFQDQFVIENFVNVRDAYFTANGIASESIEQGNI
jgi:hypothetical protein